MHDTQDRYNAIIQTTRAHLTSWPCSNAHVLILPYKSNFNQNTIWKKGKDRYNLPKYQYSGNYNTRFKGSTVRHWKEVVHTRETNLLSLLQLFLKSNWGYFYCLFRQPHVNQPLMYTVFRRGQLLYAACVLFEEQSKGNASQKLKPWESFSSHLSALKGKKC